MILTEDEFKELGFAYDPQNDALIEDCIKRAEYILNALCGGTLASEMAQSESGAALVKQATAFQADALLKDAQSGGITRVSLGDLSYTEEEAKNAFGVPNTVKRLLRAAGCFYGAAVTEVIE